MDFEDKPLLLQLRVGDTSVVDSAQLFLENTLDIADILESDGTLRKVPFGNLPVDDTVNQTRDILLGILRKTPRSCFHGIGHHEDSRFHRMGIGARIGKQAFIDLHARMLVLVGNIEIFGLAQAMMSANKVSNHFGQVMLLG